MESCLIRAPTLVRKSTQELLARCTFSSKCCISRSIIIHLPFSTNFSILTDFNLWTRANAKSNFESTSRRLGSAPWILAEDQKYMIDAFETSWSGSYIFSGPGVLFDSFSFITNIVYIFEKRRAGLLGETTTSKQAHLTAHLAYCLGKIHGKLVGDIEHPFHAQSLAIRQLAKAHEGARRRGRLTPESRRTAALQELLSTFPRNIMIDRNPNVSKSSLWLMDASRFRRIKPWDKYSCWQRTQTDTFTLWPLTEYCQLSTSLSCSRRNMFI